jgi:hypothetical protein
MKNTLYLAVIAMMTVILLYSCSSDNPLIPPVTAISNISGSVVNWTLGTQKIFVRVNDSTYFHHMDLDTGTINSDGTFSVELPAVPSEFLVRFSPGDTSCTGSITVTPSYSRFSSVSLVVCNSNGIPLGHLFRKNYDSTQTAGSFFTLYDYHESAVTTSGQIVCNPSDTTIFSLSDVAGWNKDVLQVTAVSGGLPVRTLVSNTEPAGGKWYYVPLEVEDPGK